MGSRFLLMLILVGKTRHIPLLNLGKMVHSLVKISHTHLELHLHRDAMWTLHVHSINEKAT